ncbi:MAG: ATP-binding protein [Coxiellaceae bacterium]|nr:ATP-binding protein [Coxiellaceae bacterium]
MRNESIQLIHQANPWLDDPSKPIFAPDRHYIPRLQETLLLDPEWDKLCTVLVGPRQAGKSTLGMHLCHQLIHIEQRWSSLLYLNCDLLAIRQWLTSTLFYQQAQQHFKLEKPIVFIDEVQRLESPGLFLKSFIDLRLPIKLVVSGSSQLELKSKVQEHLTGRQLECTIYPLSWQEGGFDFDRLLYGCYPDVVESINKAIILEQLYNNYINKDIIEILKISKPDMMQKLITLIAHSAGQLVNYNQLATDCKINLQTIHNYLAILEATYVLYKITPFVGNKRKEVVTNPIYYFIDNGFRNQALKNFQPLEQRTDMGLLVENAVFQQLLKYKIQYKRDYKIHFWRTRSGAEIDFVLHYPDNTVVPIEAKYRNLSQPKLARAFHSFIEAYQPKTGFVITQDYNDQRQVGDTMVHFIALPQWQRLFDLLDPS